ncbi:MAG: hypothetical protein Sylvanvirus25_9 [Sylvanvirus sp.]|uniref:MYM-type domain-containing protein n=1 Tax=Sylvanvirus sp. TaxID=2487774 RepID=A0A3G5AIT6_9VIRU|nr:MAG: hypothetical protein Sylvanvirus25_9 [Sylvanvirus sp.]
MPPASSNGRAEQKITYLSQLDPNDPTSLQNPFVESELHPLRIGQLGTEFWTTPLLGKLSCWQCGHKIHGIPIPIPMTFNPEKKVYKIQGAVCAPPCAMSFILAKEGHLVNDLKVILTMMLKEVYGIKHIIRPINKLIFIKYGGPLPHSEYLRTWAHLPIIRVRGDHPFIPVDMMIEYGMKKIPFLQLKAPNLAPVSQVTQPRMKITKPVKVQYHEQEEKEDEGMNEQKAVDMLLGHENDDLLKGQLNTFIEMNDDRHHPPPHPTHLNFEPKKATTTKSEKGNASTIKKSTSSKSVTFPTLSSSMSSSIPSDKSKKGKKSKSSKASPEHVSLSSSITSSSMLDEFSQLRNIIETAASDLNQIAPPADVTNENSNSIPISTSLALDTIDEEETNVPDIAVPTKKKRSNKQSKGLKDLNDLNDLKEIKVIHSTKISRPRKKPSAASASRSLESMWLAYHTPPHEENKSEKDGKDEDQRTDKMDKMNVTGRIDDTNEANESNSSQENPIDILANAIDIHENSNILDSGQSNENTNLDTLFIHDDNVPLSKVKRSSSKKSRRKSRS